jgi:hypothetical protein
LPVRASLQAWSVLAAALLAGAGCAKETTDFASGVEPWEVPASAPAEWPDAPTTPGTVAIQTGTRLGSGEVPSHYWAHGRALLAEPLPAVWAALQWTPGVLVGVFPDYPTVDCEPVNGFEAGYELSYAIREIPNEHGELGRANWFKVAWRGAATRDAAQSIARVNLKAQKVDGTVFIQLMRQSVVATPAPGGGTALEIVRHINAPDESEQSAGEWIQLWVQALQAELAGTRESILPASWCFP